MPRKGKGQKVQSAGGQGYGERVKQEEAQRAIPLPETPRIQPGAAGPLTRPTEQPRQPVTSGAGVGPGPGAEALAVPQGAGDKEMSERLAAYLPLLETKAAQPEATANFRMFVRRVRDLAVNGRGVY
ncbi:MAG: hypothetical protein HN683_19645 [Gammaproteobacteria bacterium]|jgi:hypothetical protein|nr:hypothetical protein [Gammaproteobacteria bacterium]